MMIWVIGIVCFLVGLFVGALLFQQLKSDAVKVEKLEEQLRDLQSDFDHYRNNVHSHFSGTAQLFDNLTESYREVYSHLAAGARSLCPENISSQLFLSENRDQLVSGSGEPDSSVTNNFGQNSNPDESVNPLFPPRDYADREHPDEKGSLSEDYGLDKPETPEPEEVPKPAD